MSVRMSESIITLVLFALLVPVAVLPWVHWQYRRRGRLRGWSAVVAAGSALYGCGLVAFTLFPLPDVTAEFCTSRPLRDYWQTRPFASLDDIAAAGFSPTSPAFLQVALNVVLFVPLGFLLRYRFGRGVVASTAIGSLVSLAVEATQGTAVFGLYPCPYRIADVDDLMVNTAGALVGWLLARWVGRLLPAAVPEPVPDTGPPGLLRRGFAFAGDLLTMSLVQFACRAVLVLLGEGTGTPRLTDLATSDWFGAAVGVLVPVVATVVVPLLRVDRATPGQIAFNLALADARTGGVAPARAVVLRFVFWWLPVLLLISAGHSGVVFFAAVVIGLAARSRTDRRSLLGLISSTNTTTARVLRSERPCPTSRTPELNARNTPEP
ncbi:VanZ family protein [Saccharothrix sp. S26]|uniref:VanZ family protein n=1 Tax=Saccharothrix sp. S26 TaxID=2907215 RepID=UPI001F3ED0A0|nr:VanZ family protein [Saccharothrix sp. S26]MCE6997254.1 VanZ family protein [Saccharothrix sp. S26]